MKLPSCRRALMLLAFMAIPPAPASLHSGSQQGSNAECGDTSYTPVLGKQLPQGRGREVQPSPCQTVPVNKRNGQEEPTTAETRQGRPDALGFSFRIFRPCTGLVCNSKSPHNLLATVRNKKSSLGLDSRTCCCPRP